MTKPLDPYSRIYWRVLNDDRFEEVRSDMRHFGSWALMLVVADMAYPAPAFVPPTIPKASLQKLTEVGLVDILRGGLFHVHGLPAERAKRNRTGTNGEPDRTPTGAGAGPNGHPSGTAPDPLARAIDEPSQDETRGSQDEHTAREDDPDGEAGVFAFIAQRGAWIRPDSGFGIRLLGLIERRSPELVMEKAKAMDDGEPKSDRQWVFGLEKALEAIPSPPMDELLPVEDPKANRRDEKVWARRLEYFQQTGKWDPELGPEPEWQPEWGDRPKVAA